MDQLQTRLQSVPESGLKGLYAGMHGSRGEWGVPPAQASYFPDLPDGHYERGVGLIPRMFPNAPKAHKSTRPYSYNEGGNVYLTPNASPSAMAHENEHWQQGATVMPDNLAGAVAAEYGPSLLSQLMPMASWQSNNTIPTQQTGYGLRLGPNYQRDLAWVHNQAQRHGVFGQTPMAKAMGYKGTGAQPITGLMAGNPQWFNMAAGIPAPEKKYAPGLLRNPSGPDLRGYLP